MQTAIAPSLGTTWQWRGQSIYYVKAGPAQPQKPPLLLVHGFGASTDHWRKNIAELQTEFEVWAIDLLGFGRSAKPNWDYSGLLWRDQLQDFITEVIGQPVVLAGNSIGGYVVLAVAAQYPQSANGLILLNPAGPFTEVPARPQTNTVRNWVGTVARSLLLQPLPSLLLFNYLRQKSTIRKTLKKVYLDHSAITEQLVDDIHRPALDPGAAQVFAAVFKAPQGEKNDLLLNQVQCPLLMLWGEQDPWMRPRQGGALYRKHYPSLTEHYLHAGHCPHDEVPGQVNALIREWMQQHVTSPEQTH
ncbi:MAG: alpha/beta fold hydrolase [Kaiparowitsia implicata GSE-PSE-MK54-09C]|jgi:pimeloyl-ACP methyl ester carboxylesterase|nr:alpha/beta fold hydrolase [Kaiparowitsia implicata GSE-PSE-MK54-09C]